MNARVSLEVSYGQIAIFLASISLPFNDWTEAHVNQGFTWRPGSVSFGTKIGSGLHEVEITCSPYADAPPEGALRSVEVPFTVSGPDPVVVASISDNFELEIPEGSYALRFTIMVADPTSIRLSFLRTDSPQFCILLADDELKPSEPLVTHAEPA